MPEAASPLADFVRRHDPDRFLCALFAPAAKRDALLALTAYNHELARAREAATNPIAAQIRLQWWRDVVEEAAARAPARRHEVAGPLAAAIAVGELDTGDLIAMADAREAETEEAIPSRGALIAYLRGSSGGWAVAAGRLLGAPDAVLPALQTLGAAYGMAGILRSVPAHAAQGRCLLPLDALEEAGLSAEAVMAEPAAGLPVAQALAAEGVALLEAGRATPIPRSAIAAALPAVLAARDLRRVGRMAGRPCPRGFADRMAVTLAGLRGRI